MKPFEYGCVVKGEVFCPRPEIESILASNMEKEYKIFNPFLREWIVRIS